MNAPPTASPPRNRRMLVGLALLFFAPLAIAFYLYYGHEGWHPGHQVNRGTLVNPARPTPAVALKLFNGGDAAATPVAFTDPNLLRKKWTFLYVGDGACTERCKTQLYNTRQVRIALDREMDRVQRVFIARGTCCDAAFLHAEHPDLIVIDDSPADAALLALLPTYDGVAATHADRVYIIDPLGNLMMSYAPDAKPKGLLEDIKRLLRLSSVG